MIAHDDDPYMAMLDAWHFARPPVPFDDFERQWIARLSPNERRALELARLNARQRELDRTPLRR